MKDGICPKCEESEVYGNGNFPHGILVDRMKILPIDTVLLVCTNCGYLEFYIENEQDLAKLKTKFQKVEN